MKTNLAQQLRDNLKKRKQQKTNIAPAFLVRAVRDNCALNGTIQLAGAKNAALPMMIATLLTDEPVALDNLPALSDVSILTAILEELGSHIELEPHARRIVLQTKHIKTSEASAHLVRQMRASFWILAPLLARTQRARVFLPGGDNIGKRGVDIYLDGLKALGASIELNHHYVEVRAKKLTGAKFQLHFPSVGATHVLLMAACSAQGETKLINAAREPEIVALAEMLKQMGAQIEGAGSSEISIQGGARLGATHASIPADRIEAGTYMIAAALCSGKVKIENAPLAHLQSLLEKLREAEIPYVLEDSAITIARAPNQKIAAVDITTAPYPDFPTDLQAQWTTLMTQAEGQSKITETLFENRFQHIKELNQLGANISLDGQTATIQGKTPLYGADVNATDIRASACLVLAALIAQGETHIKNIFHLERGFEKMEEKFNRCGAHIERVSFQ